MKCPDDDDDEPECDSEDTGFIETDQVEEGTEIPLDFCV